MPPEGTDEPTSWIPRPSASRVQTPRAGSPRLTERPRAVAIPTRMPVKVPGPSPTASRSTRSQPPAAAAACSTSSSSPVACRGLPCGESPSCDSCRTSPSRQAQATVSTVAVSKPTTIRGALPRDLERPGPDFLAFDVPADDVAADDRRGDLVDVERPLFGLLGLGAEVFPARELDADGVGDFAVQAFEEGPLLRLLRAGVGGLGVLGDPAADVVFVGGRARAGGRHYSQQPGHQRHGHQRLQSLHVLPFCVEIPSVDATSWACHYPSAVKRDVVRCLAGPLFGGSARPRAPTAPPVPGGRVGPPPPPATRRRRRHRGAGSRRAAPGPRPRGSQGGRDRGGRPASARPRSAGRS